MKNERIRTNQRCLQILEYENILKKWSESANTQKGKEEIQAYVPFSDEEVISEKLDETQQALQVLNFHPDYHFGGVFDLNDPIKRAEIGSLLTSEDFMKIWATVETTNKHRKFFSDLELEVPLIKEKSSQLVSLGELENQFSNMLNSHGEFLDDASPELFRIRRGIHSIRNNLRGQLDHILKATENQKYFQETFFSVRNNRYVIPVKQEYRYQFPGIVHDQSASGQTLFIEPMALVEMNNELAQLISGEKNEIERLLGILTQIIFKNSGSLQENSRLLTDLDVIFAKGKFSRSFRGVRPAISANSEIKLLNARHLLLNPDTVVPVTIDMTDRCKALVITGPNTGGKTVALKTTGLMVAMHQSGLFIPVSEGSQIPIFSGIFSDIGDEQSLEQNLSTFSGHMTQIIEILDKLTPSNNLVLLDELGAGTDPEEGTALAIAIIEKLMKTKAKTLFTSHYSELKAYAFSHPQMENASMEFDVSSLKPTYRLILGLPGESNALLISKRLGLSQDIVDQASSHVRLETKELNQLLASLRSQKEKLEDELVSLEKSKEIADQEKQKFYRDQLEWKEKQKKSEVKLQEEVRIFLKKGKEEVDEILSSLKEMRQQNVTGADLERQIQKEKDRLRAIQSGIPSLTSTESLEIISEELLPGDSVYIQTLKTSGKVLIVDENEVLVEVGSMKLKLPKLGLRKSAGPFIPDKAADKGRRKITRMNEKNEKKLKAQMIGTEIDVRGENAEDAIFRVEKFIDESILVGTPYIRIIHGKGTGVLKTQIHQMLKAHPHIKSFSLAPLNQGGDGATEVKLN